jgi:hypothetical protein
MPSCSLHKKQYRFCRIFPIRTLAVTFAKSCSLLRHLKLINITYGTEFSVAFMSLKWRTTTFWLSATAYSVHFQLPSIPEEDAKCHHVIKYHIGLYSEIFITVHNMMGWSNISSSVPTSYRERRLRCHLMACHGPHMRIAGITLIFVISVTARKRF